MAHTLTITLDDQTYAELERMAQSRGETPEGVAAFVVKGLCDDPLDKHIGAYPSDPLLSLAGSLDTGIPDLAERHDEYLAEASDPGALAVREKPDSPASPDDSLHRFIA